MKSQRELMVEKMRVLDQKAELLDEMQQERELELLTALPTLPYSHLNAWVGACKKCGAPDADIEAMKAGRFDDVSPRSLKIGADIMEFFEDEGIIELAKD